MENFKEYCGAGFSENVYLLSKDKNISFEKGEKCDDTFTRPRITAKSVGVVRNGFDLEFRFIASHLRNVKTFVEPDFLKVCVYCQWISIRKGEKVEVGLLSHDPGPQRNRLELSAMVSILSLGS